MTPPDDAKPWEALALTAALPQDRELLELLLELDRRLARIVDTSSEAMLGQIRLAWWRDVLQSDAPPKGEPLIARIQQAEARVAWAIKPAMQRMVDGWEARLLSPEEPEAFARERGEGLFTGFAGPDAPDGLKAASRVWSLAEVGQTSADFDIAETRSWPRRLRPLSLLLLAARSEGRFAGLRLSWHGLTGR